MLAVLVVVLGWFCYRQWRQQQAAADYLTQLGETHRQELRQAQTDYRQLAAALGCLSEGVLLCNAGGELVLANHTVSSLTLTSHGQALLQDAIDEHLAAARQGKATRKELQLYGPPHQTLLLHAFPLSNGNADGYANSSTGGGADGTASSSANGNTASSAVAIIEDITHQLRQETIRRDLVTNIGHELRTPVGAIGVLADAMQSETKPETLLELSRSIGKESARLTQIVEDLLELSQLEQDQREHATIVAMQDVVNRAITRVSGVAHQHGSEISAQLAGEPVCVQGDPFQLTSAVFNLLENAIKYSQPQTPVTISLKAVDGQAELAVQDQGIGIPRNDQSRLFERFYRVDRARSGTVGNGLGLALVRQVAVHHNGEVTVESEEGVGSTFVLRLPACQPA